MKFKDQILKNIEKQNGSIINDDKRNVVIIFQFITMTGIIAITAFLLYFTIFKLTTHMNFRTVLPIIPLEKMLEQKIVDRLFVKQIVAEIYDTYTDLEADFFTKTYSKREYHDSISAALYANIGRSSDILSYDILEVHQEFGTSLYDPETKEVILTDSGFTVLVQEFIISPSEKVTADKRSVVVDILFDRDNQLKGLEVISRHPLIDKNLFKDYLLTVHEDNIKNNLSYKSPISSLSMSFMDIESVSFSDLKMTTTTEGYPIGNTTLTMNNNRYVATVEYSKTGNPILIVEE